MRFELGLSDSSISDNHLPISSIAVPTPSLSEVLPEGLYLRSDDTSLTSFPRKCLVTLLLKEIEIEKILEDICCDLLEKCEKYNIKTIEVRSLGFNIPGKHYGLDSKIKNSY